jgi:hypothetical protein
VDAGDWRLYPMHSRDNMLPVCSRACSHQCVPYFLRWSSSKAGATHMGIPVRLSDFFYIIFYFCFCKPAWCRIVAVHFKSLRACSTVLSQDLLARCCSCRYCLYCLSLQRRPWRTHRCVSSSIRGVSTFARQQCAVPARNFDIILLLLYIYKTHKKPLRIQQHYYYILYIIYYNCHVPHATCHMV